MTAGRPHVLIAGAGVAGLEAVLALRASLGDNVDITIVSPETKFVNSSMALNEPSNPSADTVLRSETSRAISQLAGIAARFAASTPNAAWLSPPTGWSSLTTSSSSPWARASRTRRARRAC